MTITSSMRISWSYSRPPSRSLLRLSHHRNDLPVYIRAPGAAAYDQLQLSRLTCRHTPLLPFAIVCYPQSMKMIGSSVSVLAVFYTSLPELNVSFSTAPGKPRPALSIHYVATATCTTRI
ncbi:unnamed protein product, partial [Nesidiocoris tenuis]